MQDGQKNSDASALADSDRSQKFSATDSRENFIRSNLLQLEPGSTV
jgi:hypothetical protein